MGMNKRVDGGTSCALPATPMMRVSHTVSEMRQRRGEAQRRGEKRRRRRRRRSAQTPPPATVPPRILIHSPSRWLQRKKQGREEAGEQRTHHGPNPQLPAPHSVWPQRTFTAVEPRTDHAVAHQKRVQMNGQPHLDKMRVIFIQNAGFVAAFSPFRRESVMLAAFRTTDKVTDVESASAGSCQAIKEWGDESIYFILFDSSLHALLPTYHH